MNDIEIIDKDGVVTTGLEAVEATSMIAGLAKAEIDQQIATAHKFPRRLSQLISDTKSLATMSPDAAAEMNYALPRGGKTITGPSIRMAELIVSQWGNCRVGARVVHVDRVEKYLEAEGVFHDLQSNAATTSRVRRKISSKNGALFNDDMITMAGNAACSIAKRNAVLAGIPKAAWMPAYEAALGVIKGDAKTLTERREGAFKALGAFGVTQDMIFAALEVEGFEEITLEHMPTMIAWHSGLKSEEQTVEQLFGTPGTGEAPKVKGKGGKKPEGVAEKLKDAVKSDEPDEDKQTDDKPQKEGDSSESQGEPPAETQSGDIPKPDSEELQDARDRGEVAFSKGRSRKTPPKDIKADPDLVRAFEEGFDEAKSASEAEQ